MSDKYLYKLIQDPDNLEQTLTIKDYIDLYTEVINKQTNQNYTIVECIDYLLEKKQIDTVNIELIDKLCEIYVCDKEELKTYYESYLQLEEVSVQENKSESSYSEYSHNDFSDSKSDDTQLNNSEISIDEISPSEDMDENVELNKKEKLKYSIKQLLGKTHEEKINDINLQIDNLFSNILEKDNGNHNNDYKYVIKNNEEQIKNVLSEIEFLCRLTGKQVEDNVILEIKKLVFKTIIDKCVEMYNTKNRKTLNITKIKKIKHFKDLVQLSSSLGILQDKSREFGSELNDFCKVNYLNEKLEMNNEDIRVKINDNTYEILKGKTSLEINKSNKKDIFKKICKANNISAIKVKVNEIDILSKVIEAIDGINSARQVNSSYQSLNEF